MNILFVYIFNEIDDNIEFIDIKNSTNGGVEPKTKEKVINILPNELYNIC